MGTRLSPLELPEPDTRPAGYKRGLLAVWRLQVQDRVQGLSRLGVWGGPASWFTGGIFSRGPHMGGGTRALWRLFKRTLIPPRQSSLTASSLLEAPPPDTTTLGGRCPRMNFGGPQTSGSQQTLNMLVDGGRVAC